MAETHWRRLTNQEYLGSWDLEKGEERTLTISAVRQQDVFNPSSLKTEKCMVATFRENSKPMILNKTNCKMITAVYGTPYIEQWAGCKIVIGVDRVKAKGELVEALRIRNKKPTAQAKQTACAECGKPIQAMGNYSADQVADLNMKRYGVAICAECSNKRKEAYSNASDA